MAEIIYYVAASLDGFIATADGGVDWLAPFEGTDEDYGYKTFFGGLDGLVMGSRTYEQARKLGEWPYRGKPSWVMSKRSLDVSVPDVTVSAKRPSELLSEFDARKLKRVWLVGGAQLAASFRANGMIDEYVISVVPLLLGGGIALFATPGASEKLKLVETKSYSSGLVQLRYVRAASA